MTEPQPKYANPEVFDAGLEVRIADGDAKLFLHDVCIASLDPGQWLALRRIQTQHGADNKEVKA